ncbi:MAG: hypothetical protein OEV40_29150 [Acidimicrobiia bacterium]|nr:hypothetical protein [Acidimicrobiia bacterium]
MTVDRAAELLEEHGDPALSDNPGLQLVALDVVTGLAGVFEGNDEGGPPFAVLQGYEPMTEPGRLFEEDFALGVPWTWSCVHTGPIGQRESGGEPIALIPSTGVELVMEGVTLLRRSGDTIELRRYIDWNLILASLGVTNAIRPGEPPARSSSTTS